MASKGKSQQEGDGDSQQADTIIIGKYLRLNISTDLVPSLKDLVQRLCREEFDRHLFPRSTINNPEAGTSGARFLQLEFESELPATILTFSKIKAKEDAPVKIALYDITTQTIVTDGQWSSMKIEICVLDGEFGCENWTSEEFKAKTLRPRENKGKLLKGDTVIALKNGVAYITNIQVTDSSRCTRSGRFRLGATVMQEEANIREGRSKPFVVKDNRVNQKHYPPSRNDELWRLNKISRGGKIHVQLTSHGINTVDDLLRLNENNPSLLLEKFGRTRRNLREAIIEHAKTCVDRVHSCLPEPLAARQSAGECGAEHLQAPDLLSTQQGQVQSEKRHDFSHASASTSHICEAAHNDQVGSVDAELSFGMYMEGNALSLLGSQVTPMVPGVYSTENDFPFFTYMDMIAGAKDIDK